MAFFDRFKNKHIEKEDKNGEALNKSQEIEQSIAKNGSQLGDADLLKDDRIQEPDAIESNSLKAETEEHAKAEAEAATIDDAAKANSNTSTDSKGKTGIFARLRSGLQKTREDFTRKIVNLVSSSKALDDDFWDELEEILIQADAGVPTSLHLVESVKKSAKKQKLTQPAEVIDVIKQEVMNLFTEQDTNLNLNPSGLSIILVVGVNGSGKTTSIAKLAHRYKQENKRVILAAADTFRAAAIDQLQIWADRTGVELIKHAEGADPGAVVFDAVSAARGRKADILIIDTAGRLQNKTNLMKEIGKIRKIIDREAENALQEVLLVLDATTGQNAIVQARAFEEVTGVTGIILTKLDGTAKGGIVLAIAKELKLAVKLIGIGEGMEDLRDFSAAAFSEALFDSVDN